MRTFLGLVAGLILLSILGGIAVGVYNAGVSAGLAQAGAVGAGAAAPYAYGWGFHSVLGFGLLGLLVPILFLFLIFGLIRAAMGGGRRGWGHHGWQGGPGPEGWRSERERYMADMHRRFHEAEGIGHAVPGSPAAPGPTAGRASPPDAAH